jgi:hypothetical protein
MLTDGDLPGRYREAKLIGSGGWAQVFRCIDDHDGRVVAVKLFHRRLDDPVSGAADFRRECQVASVLSAHPGIVTLRGAGIAGSGRPWLAMDFAPNGTLADTVRNTPGRAIPLERALDLTAVLADALAWAHRLPSPVVHGDLKPANILLDAAGRPLLTDFGVASRLGDGHSVTVTQFTQTHAAPEVLRDGRASVSADVWSLTATLVELLTGAPPFIVRPGEGAGAFIDRVCEGLPAGAIPRGVPEPVADLIRHGLAVRREDRIATMTGLAERIRAAQGSLGLPITSKVQAPTDAVAAEISFSTYTDAIALTTARPLHLHDPVRPSRARRTRWPLVIAAILLVLVAGGAVAAATTGLRGDPLAINAAASRAVRVEVGTSAPPSGAAPETRAAAPHGSLTIAATATATATTTTTAGTAPAPAGPTSGNARPAGARPAGTHTAPPPWCARSADDNVLNAVRRYYAAGDTNWTFELAWPVDSGYPAFRTPGGLYLRTNAVPDSPTGSISPPYPALTYMQGLPPGDTVNWQEISATSPGNQYSFQSLNPGVDVSSAFTALRHLRSEWWSQRNAPLC